jgi:hypothetical protein
MLVWDHKGCADETDTMLSLCGTKVSKRRDKRSLKELSLRNL